MSFRQPTDGFEGKSREVDWLFMVLRKRRKVLHSSDYGPFGAPKMCFEIG